MARLGIITPASNTNVEPTTYAMLAGVAGTTAHFSRFALPPSLDTTMGPDTLASAATLLAEAEVDVLAFHGTAGSWTGLDGDRALCAELQRLTGIPTTTASLATVAAVKALGARTLALAFPGEQWITDGIAAEYMRPLFAVLVLQMIETGGIACLVGAGDTKTGLYVLAGVAAVNVPTAAALAFGVGPVPALGFVGIAWGTALSHAAGGVAVLVLLFRGRSGRKLRPADLIPDRGLMARLLRVSVPAAVDSLSVTACQFWFLSLVNRLGDEPAAAHGIAIRWEGLGYLAGGAFGTAAISLVARNLGAGRPDLAAKSARTAIYLGGGVMTVMAAVFFVLARPMCEVFSPHNPAVVELGTQALRLIAAALAGELSGAATTTITIRDITDTKARITATVDADGNRTAITLDAT